MKTVNIQEAKTHLSRLVQEAAEGEDVVIAKAGKPMVRLTPVSTLQGPRPLGSLAGRVVEAEDCWALGAPCPGAPHSGSELPDDWLATAERTGLLEIPVTAAEARDSARLPWHHADPFDRVLVAQARRRSLHLATRDPLLVAYDVPLLAV